MPTHLPTSSSTFSHTPSARHYNSALSIWLSVDPMADKYPGVSPYVYCANNPVRLVDPNGDTIRVVNRHNHFLFSLDDRSTKNTTITAWDLYNKGIQWFEPEADNYYPLLSVSNDIEKVDGIAHYSWQEIESFSMIDRFMYSYRSGGSGDFKKDKPFLCTVDGIPYWTDAIGQIPFAINCYKKRLMDGYTPQEAMKYTQRIGHLFAKGRLTIFDSAPNDYDNMMIKRACNWAKLGFTTGGTKKCGWYMYYEVLRTDYNFNNMAVWERVK